LPLTVVGSGRYLPANGLLSYGPTTTQYAQLVASYIDRILRGAKPGDLPVAQPARFELVVSLKTARALGIAIPHSVLARADEVIQ
jgi:putative ABC transport system substrate-binding protein